MALPSPSSCRDPNAEDAETTGEVHAGSDLDAAVAVACKAEQQTVDGGTEIEESSEL